MTIEEYLKSVIDWKLFNLILSKIMDLEDKGMNFTIFICFGNKNKTHKLCMYKTTTGQIVWDISNNLENCVEVCRAFNKRYDIIYKIRPFDADRTYSLFRRIVDIMTSTNKLEHVSTDMRCVSFKSKVKSE